MNQPNEIYADAAGLLLRSPFSDLAYHMGRFEAMASAFAENHHTCDNRHERYPWPLDRNCRACCLVLEKHAKRIHAELAWLLFGFDAMLESWKVDPAKQFEWESRTIDPKPGEVDDTEEMFLAQAEHIRGFAAAFLDRHFGRCPDFEPNCESCKRWAALHILLENPYA